MKVDGFILLSVKTGIILLISNCDNLIGPLHITGIDAGSIISNQIYNY